jgi:hypothetical protein
VGGRLISAQGKTLLFTWDGAMRGPRWPPPEPIRKDARRVKAWMDAWEDSVSMVRPRLGYIHAEYPANPGAVPLPVGSSEESLLIEVLRSAVARETSATMSASERRKLEAASYVVAALQRQRGKLAANGRKSSEGKAGR